MSDTNIHQLEKRHATAAKFHAAENQIQNRRLSQYRFLETQRQCTNVPFNSYIHKYSPSENLYAD